MKWGIILLLLVTPLNALEIHGEFRVGSSLDEQAATKIRIDLVQAPVTLYGGWMTEFIVAPPWGYPLSDTYEVGVRLDWSRWFLDVNHFCEHAVWSEQKDWGSLQKQNRDQTTVSIGVRW